MICRHHRLVITLEEHSIYGGLGAADRGDRVELCALLDGRIGVPDRFAQYAGSYQYLRSEYGLDSAGISRQVNEFVERIGNPGTDLSKSSRMEIVVSEPK